MDTRLEPPSLELQALLDAAVDAVVLIDHQGIVQVFNHAAERLFGYSAEEIMGRNVSLLMTEPDRAQHDAYLQRYLRTGVAHVIGVGREVRALRRDGEVFPAFLSVGRIAGSDPPRFVGFIQDITVRERALTALQIERDRANRYLEAAQTMLVALDLDHRVTLVNRKGAEILDCDEKTLIGVDWFETRVPAGERARVLREFEQLLAQSPHRPQHCEYPVLTRDDSPRLIAWRCVAIEDAAGVTSGVLCSGDDVTDVRRAEYEAQEARERMMHVSRLATMGEMASGISHELNQPLAAITNYAQAAARLLAMPAPDLADAREALQQIAGQALRAGDIIRRLRSFVRNRQTERELANINEVIEDLGPLTRADSRASDVRVAVELAGGLPLASMDRIQIQQVVLVLVRNAIDALQEAPPGRREVSVRTGKDESGSIQIAVADTGAGVPQEIRPQLFMPFLTTKPNGTGLGLATSRSIVEAHHGRLEYRANEPHGAVFIVTLPSSQELIGSS
jgi:two-component system sensor kinase FixL